MCAMWHESSHPRVRKGEATNSGTYAIDEAMPCRRTRHGRTVLHNTRTGTSALTYAHSAALVLACMKARAVSYMGASACMRASPQTC